MYIGLDVHKETIAVAVAPEKAAAPEVIRTSKGRVYQLNPEMKMKKSLLGTPGNSERGQLCPRVLACVRASRTRLSALRARVSGSPLLRNEAERSDGTKAEPIRTE